MIEVKLVGHSFWGYPIYQTYKGTSFAKLEEGFYTLSHNNDWDSDPDRRIKDGCLQVVEEFNN